MSEGPALPNSAFSDIPIGSMPAVPADSAVTAAGELAEIPTPFEDDPLGNDTPTDPPYPFSTFSLFNQAVSSQTDARDLLGL